MVVVSLGWHSRRFWMELLQCHKVCEIGGDELHRPPVVALMRGMGSGRVFRPIKFSFATFDVVPYYSRAHSYRGKMKISMKLCKRREHLVEWTNFYLSVYIVQFINVC